MRSHAVGHEFTTVAMTYNLWGRHLWPEREPALRALFMNRDPDILAVQELCADTRGVLDDVFRTHARVHDDFRGWTCESNIWWRKGLYRLDDYGAEDIGIRKESCRLFWVKVTPLLLEGNEQLVFATAHYTWPGDRQEELVGLNPRINEARRTVEVLDRIAPHEPCIFAGDLNDVHHPVRILRRAGFNECFRSLGRTSPITSPVAPLTRPHSENPPQDIPKAIDYQFHRGPIRARTGEVVEFFFNHIPPSDHKPVIATYSLGARSRTESSGIHETVEPTRCPMQDPNRPP
jgi:hypothetical protein